MVRLNSPLGYLRALRALVVVVPALSLLALFPLTSRRAGASLSAANVADLEPALLPLGAVSVACLLVVRFLVSPDSSKALRFVAICAAYMLALATAFTCLVFSLSGAPIAWAVGGFLFGIAVINLVSLKRYAHDLSGMRGEW